MYTDRSCLILALSAEIFYLVASQIPLQYFPATLSALALTSKQMNRNVTQILYSKVVIRNKDAANDILDRILADKELGLLIRELHVLTTSTLKRQWLRYETYIDVDKLHDVIQKNLLPRLIRFNLVIFKQMDCFKTTTRDINTYRIIPREFWSDLKRCCPHIRGVFYDTYRESEEAYLKSLLYELKDLSDSNDLELASTLPDLGPGPLSSKLIPHSLADSLHSLNIFVSSYCPIDSVLSNTFPNLRSLTLSYGSLERTSKAMKFCERHSGLERLTLISEGQWFSDSVEEGLLPCLTYLKASYSNVRALKSHLGQLQHLSFTDSLNHQVPYLLRSVIPGGLPNLKSLEIRQHMTSDTSGAEGAIWYERTDGVIVETEAIKTIPLGPGYIQSIVRGAPNVEEFCLQGDPRRTYNLWPTSQYMAQFSRLERFYFRAFQPPRGKLKRNDIDRFVSTCRSIGDSCRTVRLVTDVSIMESGRYLTGKIIRDSGGKVTEVVPGRGFGMEFTGGNEDAFPHNSLL